MKKEKNDKEVCFYNRWIQPCYKKEYYTSIKVEREGKLINPRNYKEGDILYILKYHRKGKFFKILQYEIITKDGEYDIKGIREYRVWYINEIYSYGFSQELQNAILNLYKNIKC